MFNFKQYNWKHFNYLLVISVLLLAVVGAVSIRLSDGDTMFKRQMMGIVLGMFCIAFLSILDYHFVCRFVIVYYLAVVGMLVLVRFSSLGVNHGTGSYRWLDIKVTEIQPSELAKIGLILTLAVFFTKMQGRMEKFYTLVLSAVITAVPTALIMIQTDLSSSIVMMFIFVIMIFTAGLSMKIILPTIAVGIPVSVALFWYIQQPFQILLDTYQQNRILSFLNPEATAQSGMFQQNNSVQAIAAGQVYGKLLLDNPTLEYRRYDSVYVNESDFIFSVIGEEFGFLGSCIVLALFTIVIIQCIMIAKRAKDFTGKMIAIGVSAMLMFQVFANVGVATALLPNTGLPLPFLSYGLSSLVSSMISIGLVINVGLQRSKARG